VALSGDRVALGAPLEDEAGQNAGAVYFFVRNQGLWSQEVKLLPEDGENAPSFGVSVALQGSLAAVGAPASEEGSTYTYELVGNTWSATGQLFAPDGHIDDRFGGALRLNGNRLFIGAKGDDQMGDGAGAVFVFHHTPIGWEFETKLVPPVVTPGAAFGTCIALDGNTAVVGAFAENDEIGAAYVFERRTGEWLPVAKLLASDGLPGDQFAAVSIDGALAVVGARGRDVVYVFSMTDYDSDGIGNNNDNCLTVANADQRDTDGDLYGNRCDPDFNEDGMINFVDLGVMKENFFSDDPDADLDGDGNVNFVDLGIMKAVFFGAPGPSGLVP